MDQKLFKSLSACKRLQKFKKIYIASEENDLQEFLNSPLFQEQAQISSDNVDNRSLKDILFCGYVGLSGSVLMADHARDLLGRRPSLTYISKIYDYYEYIYNADQVADIIRSEAPDIQFVSEAISEGGLYKALYDIGHKYNRGFDVSYGKVPLLQPTIEFCECFEADPWQLYSAGCLILITDKGKDLCDFLRKNGILCHKIGGFRRDNDKIIRFRDEDRLMNHPQPDELLKVLIEKSKVQ